MFEEQLADRELERIGIDSKSPFGTKKASLFGGEDFEESHWNSLRTIQNIREQARLRLQRYADLVETRLLAA
jgi:hypothetical protein